MNEQTQLTASDQEAINRSLTTGAPIGFMTINGLEGIPTNIIGMPRVKLVQPVSQNVELATGADATPGTFFYSDSLTSRAEMNIAIITAKKQRVSFTDEKTGVETPTERIGLLFYDLDAKKVYITSLSVTSFGAFGKLMGLMAAEEWENAWDKTLKVTSEKVEGQRGKYFVMKFTVGAELTDELAETITDLWTTYNGYFAREDEAFED